MGKTKSVTFRRGGPLRKSDVLYYEGRKIEFVPNFNLPGGNNANKGRVLWTYPESQTQRHFGLH